MTINWTQPTERTDDWWMLGYSCCSRAAGSSVSAMTILMTMLRATNDVAGHAHDELSFGWTAAANYCCCCYCWLVDVTSLTTHLWPSLLKSTAHSVFAMSSACLGISFDLLERKLTEGKQYNEEETECRQVRIQLIAAQVINDDDDNDGEDDNNSHVSAVKCTDLYHRRLFFFVYKPSLSL